LEGGVAALFKLDVVVEARLEKFVDLLLEIQEFLRELGWVLDELIIVHDLLSFLLDVVAQAAHNDVQVRLLAAEALIHQVEFVNALILDHVAGAGLLLDYFGLHQRDQLIIDLAHELGLRLRL
jgi:hypothetical protein